MTPRQRRKRLIVARLVYKARWRKVWQEIKASGRRFSAAMAEVYRQAREKQA